MKYTRPNLAPTLLMCAALLMIGGIFGFVARPLLMPVGVGGETTGDRAVTEAHSGHGNATVLELNESIVASMGVKTGKLELRDYVRKIRIPAEVDEYVPQGRQSVVAPLAGSVTQVFVTRGESVKPKQKLFELSITDTTMSEAQLDLMSAVSEIEAQQKRLDRLRPLASNGAIAGKRVIDLELNIEQLRRRKETLTEELRIRGVDAVGMELVENGKQLIRKITVFAPELEREIAFDGLGLDETSGEPSTWEDQAWFMVESIAAEKGKTFKRGETLCDLTWHGKLLVKGMAFQSDMRAIDAAAQSELPFTASFGESENRNRREGLKLFSIDSHVDPESQTFPVYVELANEILSRHRDADGRWHVNWRFKSGQRAHLEVPVERWTQQVVAPRGAIVNDGPGTYVFKKMNHIHQSSDGSVIVEFEKIPVKVLHTDTQHVVLEDQMTLDTYEHYALNKAHQLNLALKRSTSGGGGQHSHHGHSH